MSRTDSDRHTVIFDEKDDTPGSGRDCLGGHASAGRSGHKGAETRRTANVPDWLRGFVLHRYFPPSCATPFKPRADMRRVSVKNRLDIGTAPYWKVYTHVPKRLTDGIVFSHGLYALRHPALSRSETEANAPACSRRFTEESSANIRVLLPSSSFVRNKNGFAVCAC